MLNSIEETVYNKQVISKMLNDFNTMKIGKPNFYNKTIDVVISRVVYNVTLKELATEYGISTERIRHIEAKGIRMMKSLIIGK